MNNYWILSAVLFLCGCTGLPDNVQPVDGFALDKYLGKWYEIARLDHSFERGMEQVSAEYSLKEDGGVRVLNRGFSSEDNEWGQAEGKAYFVGSEDIGHLKVSFFGPFYASYAVFGLDKDNYQYAFVSGNSHDYLWLLSRTPTVSQALIEKFLKEANDRGFDTDAIIMVKQQ